METDKSIFESDFVIDSSTREQLEDAIGWAKIWSVTGFIIGALFALLGLVIFMFSSNLMILLAWLTPAVFFMAGSMLLRKVIFQTIEVLNNPAKEELSVLSTKIKVFFRYAAIAGIIAVVLSIFSLIGLVMSARFGR